MMLFEVLITDIIAICGTIEYQYEIRGGRGNAAHRTVGPMTSLGRIYL